MTRRPVPALGVAALLLTACGTTPPPSSPPAVGGDAVHAHPLRDTQRASRSAHRPPVMRVDNPRALAAPAGAAHDRGFHAWARSTATLRVFRCESGWNPAAVNPSGKYRGLIQADATFWASWGGLRYASRPDQATTGQQLRVAYTAWQARGWQPWTCSRIVGVR